MAGEEERQCQASSSGSRLLGLTGGIKIPDSLATNLRFAEQAAKMYDRPDYSSYIPLVPPPPSAALIEANRLDDLVATVVRASQRVEDLEEELRRLGKQPRRFDGGPAERDSPDRHPQAGGRRSIVKMTAGSAEIMVKPRCR